MMDAAVYTLLPLSVILASLPPAALPSACVCVCPSGSCLYPEYLAQPAERCRCQQFTASPERKFLTLALLGEAVICVLVAYFLKSKPQITNLIVLYCCL